jgi:hypothetical protein
MAAQRLRSGAWSDSLPTLAERVATEGQGSQLTLQPEISQSLEPGRNKYLDFADIPAREIKRAYAQGERFRNVS